MNRLRENEQPHLCEFIAAEHFRGATRFSDDYAVAKERYRWLRKTKTTKKKING